MQFDIFYPPPLVIQHSIHVYLVMTVDPGLYLAVENEDHELVLQVGDGSIEAGSHQSQIGRQVRAEKYMPSDMKCQVRICVMSMSSVTYLKY